MLKHDPVVKEIAIDLGLSPGKNALKAILDYCKKTVSRAMGDFDGQLQADTILLHLANHLGTCFRVIHNSKELLELKQLFLKSKELGFVNLDQELDPETFGITIRRQNRKAWETEFVSVIDCRG